MADVTLILSQIESGDPSAAEKLLPLVYEELRRLAAARLAQEKPGQTLQATALVHDAYIRLVDVEKAQHWNSRGHFFGAAAEAMRRILVDEARRKNAVKRGGGGKRVAFDGAEAVAIAAPDEILLLDESLEELGREDPLAGKIVELRYFAGLSVEDAALALGISAATAYRHWSFARAWLHCHIGQSDRAAESGKNSSSS
jgi:RNA polymerase sigma factor (TIGR02999 family)